MDHTLLDQAVIASVAVWLLERLKAWTGTPWVSQATDKLNRWLSALLATLSAAGILVVTNWSGFETGSLVITVTGLTLANILTFLWTIAQNLALQEWFYRIYKGSMARPPV